MPRRTRDCKQSTLVIFRGAHRALSNLESMEPHATWLAWHCSASPQLLWGSLNEAFGTTQADTSATSANCHQDSTRKREGDFDGITGQDPDSPAQEESPCNQVFLSKLTSYFASLTVPKRLIKRNAIKFVSPDESYPLEQPRTPHPSEEITRV